MGSIPLIADQWHPQDPLEVYSRLQALQQQQRASQQQQQLQQSQLQLQQQTYAANARKQREGEVIRQAFVKTMETLTAQSKTQAGTPMCRPRRSRHCSNTRRI